MVTLTYVIKNTPY